MICACSRDEHFARQPWKIIGVNARELWLHKALSKGVADELGGGMDVELAHRGGAMGLDRLDADAEQQRRPLVAVALGDELNDLAFARRQRVGLVLRSGLLEEIVQQYLRDLIREIGVVQRQRGHG